MYPNKNPRLTFSGDAHNFWDQEIIVLALTRFQRCLVHQQSRTQGYSTPTSTFCRGNSRRTGVSKGQPRPGSVKCGENCGTTRDIGPKTTTMRSAEKAREVLRSGDGRERKETHTYTIFLSMSSRRSNKDNYNFLLWLILLTRSVTGVLYCSIGRRVRNNTTYCKKSANLNLWRAFKIF